jgi:hypothetical protein
MRNTGKEVNERREKQKKNIRNKEKEMQAEGSKEKKGNE